MKILAIDTATEACSAALYIGDETIVSTATSTEKKNIVSRYQLAPREHSRLILKMIDEVLVQADQSVSDLDAIAFGRGPGSFMGLRIAAGVVQGIAFAHDLPVIPVSTLKAIALRAYETSTAKNVLATIDARMDEVYWAAYSLQQKEWQLLGEERVISPEKLASINVAEISEEGWIGAGNGWKNYKDRLLSAINTPQLKLLPDCLPAAESIARLASEDFLAGKLVSAAEAIPVYLRNDVARKASPVVL